MCYIIIIRHWRIVDTKRWIISSFDLNPNSGMKHPTYDDYGCTELTALIGDGICDDNVNTNECFYDFGDCCDAASDKTFCTDCACHEPVINETYQGTY